MSQPLRLFSLPRQMNSFIDARRRDSRAARDALLRLAPTPDGMSRAAYCRQPATLAHRYHKIFTLACSAPPGILQRRLCFRRAAPASLSAFPLFERFFRFQHVYL